MSPDIHILGIPGIPEVAAGDDLAALITSACERHGAVLANDDILVVTQKIVSKAEGCVVPLSEITPSSLARSYAAEHGKDPRAVETALQQAKRIVKMDRVLITETHHGFVCANSGVDRSNIADEDSVATLPRDPDASATELRAALHRITGKTMAVIISDTFGRPWREGVTDVAIGSAGIRPLVDYRGKHDVHGRELSTTLVASADELAAAADLVMGKTDNIPVALIRGFRVEASTDGAKALIRDPSLDLFR